jgi:hypothetical protein
MTIYHESIEEHAVAAKLVDLLLARGKPVSVWDSEEETVTDSMDREEILQALATTDQDTICSGGFCYLFIWGQGSAELISDYSYPRDLREEADTIFEQSNAAVEELRATI